MIYMIKISTVLPPNNNIFIDYDCYKEKVAFKLRLNGLKEMDEVQNDLFETLFNLSEEEYKAILKKCNASYSIYKSNAKYISNLLKETDNRVEDLNTLLSIISTKDNIIRSIMSNNYNKANTSEEMELITDRLLYRGEGLDQFNDKFMTATLKYRNNPLFSEYITSYNDDKIIEELTKACKSRLKMKISFENKKKDAIYDPYQTNIKTKEIKRKNKK